MRVAIAAVPYSSNLGDGVIHEVMSRILEQSGQVAGVATIDISGRTRHAGTDAGERARRKRGLSIINSLPAFARSWVVLLYTALLYWRRYRHQQELVLANVDHVIIGGGHLLSDLDLNFPVKLYCLFKGIRKFNIPFSIYAVGVANNWTPLGRLFFRALLQSPLLKGITVRDVHSRTLLERELRSLKSTVPLSLVLDPAVATALVYPHAGTASAPGQGRHIGLNVADTGLLSAAGDCSTGISDGIRFFLDIVSRLQGAGYHVTLFTNGAEEDERFLDRLSCTPGLVCQRARRPLLPLDLVSRIQEFDLVISHRLHANIICFSYGLPSIGLAWDRKLQSFFEQTGRAHCLVDASNGRNPDVPGRILALLARPDDIRPAAFTAAAADARRQLLASLATTVLS